MIFIGSRLLGGVGERLQHLALQHPDLLLRRLELLLAEARQLEAAQQQVKVLEGEVLKPLAAASQAEADEDR